MQVHPGHKDQRRSLRLLHAEVQITIHFQVERFMTVPAFGLDGDGKFFLTELPLHEGRRNCVGRSGSIQLFAGTELNPVRGRIDRYRVSPGNRAGAIAEQERHGVLQFIQDGADAFER